MCERKTEVQDADVPLRSKPQLVLIRIDKTRCSWFRPTQGSRFPIYSSLQGSAITLGSGFLATGAASDANVDPNGTSLEVCRQVEEGLIRGSVVGQMLKAVDGRTDGQPIAQPFSSAERPRAHLIFRRMANYWYMNRDGALHTVAGKRFVKKFQKLP